MSHEDLVRGLPLLRPPATADLFGHGPVLGDDRLGLLEGHGGAVGVADDIGHAALHDGPRPLGQVNLDQPLSLRRPGRPCPAEHRDADPPLRDRDRNQPQAAPPGPAEPGARAARGHGPADRPRRGQGGVPERGGTAGAVQLHAEDHPQRLPADVPGRGQHRVAGPASGPRSAPTPSRHRSAWSSSPSSRSLAGLPGRSIY